jgi:hypothetical protein
MAKKEKEPIPQHDEYVEQFHALAGELHEPDEVMMFVSGLPREMIIKQVDHLLDKHALDYPEIVLNYQLGRLAIEVEGMLV